MKNKKIVVLMGGPSAENVVSRNTGRAITAALQEKGYPATAVEFEPTNLYQQLRSLDCEVVFNAIHGQYGEDGYLQGALEMMGIPYTGSGVLASAVAMDKNISKKIFVASDIATPRFAIYNKANSECDIIASIKKQFSLPVVVKANCQGSSIGVVIVRMENELAAALAEAFKYSDELLVEEFITGRELTVAVWDVNGVCEALPIIEIVPHSGKYDYKSKYTKGETDYLVPAALEASAADEARRLGVKSFQALGCRGIARVDMMLDSAGAAYVLEVNTVPGMTETSLVPKAAAAVGISFPELCERLLLAAR